MPVIHLRVVGRVQGVGFRWFVRERADALGLAGWVRNTVEGEVEVAASGEMVQLDALLAHIARGPGGARVDAVRMLPEPGGTEYPVPFEIAQTGAPD